MNVVDRFSRSTIYVPNLCPEAPLINQDGRPAGTTSVASPRNPSGYRVGLGTAVHIPSVEDLLRGSRCNGESLLWISSAVQQPDGEDKPDHREHPPGSGSRAPANWSTDLPWSEYSQNSLVSAGSGISPFMVTLVTSSPSSTTRRRKQWSCQSKHTFVVARDSGDRYVQFFSTPPCSHRRGRTLACSRRHATTQDSKSSCPQRTFCSRWTAESWRCCDTRKRERTPTQDTE